MRDSLKFKRRYRDLEMRVLNELSNLVLSSDIESKHIQQPALKVDICGYTELVKMDGNLIFLDGNGQHYSLWNGDVSLEDLIDILTQNGK